MKPVPPPIRSSLTPRPPQERTEIEIQAEQENIHFNEIANSLKSIRLLLIVIAMILVVILYTVANFF